MEEPGTTGEHGIQETVDVLHALDEVAEAIVEAIHDGLDVGDAFSLLNNTQLKQALEHAATNIKAVPDELAELSPEEMFTLAHRSLDSAERVYNVLRRL